MTIVNYRLIERFVASNITTMQRPIVRVIIKDWERFRQEVEHQEKRMANAVGGSYVTAEGAFNHAEDVMKGIESTCIDPGEPFPTDSNETKLAMMTEKHKYVICRIQSMHNLLLALNTEISKTSTAAGICVRTMIRTLERVSMSFMTDACKTVKGLSNKIQAEVDAQEFANHFDKNKEGTSPGSESVEVGPIAKIICKACGLDWDFQHRCPGDTQAR